jgi:hypothetical protein
MSHSPVLFTVSSPSTSALAALAGKFNDGDWAAIGNAYYTYRSSGGGAYSFGAVPSIEGGAWIPYDDVFVQTASHEIVLPAPGGTSVFRLPLGSYVAANANDCNVDISTNGGSSWIEQQYGHDFSFYVSGQNNHPFSQPASVGDVASGINLAGLAPPTWLIRIRWIERTSPFAPRSIIPTKFVLSGSSWVRDDAVSWFTSEAADTPNGIVLPPPPSGFVPELWRITRHVGGINRVTSGITFRGGGRRLVPYFRGPQANVADPNAIVLVGASGVATPSLRKLKYRVCYYNPTLRIRTAFAPGLITYLGGARGDRHNGESSAIRTTGTVYVDPS